MTTLIHEFTVRDEMRDSPTMSAAAMADAAKARGTKVEIVTIGDLFPKPAQAEVEGWVHALMVDAKRADNGTDEKFKTIRDAAKIYAYSETLGLPSLRAAAAASTHLRFVDCARSVFGVGWIYCRLPFVPPPAGVE